MLFRGQHLFTGGITVIVRGTGAWVEGEPATTTVAVYTRKENLIVVSLIEPRSVSGYSDRSLDVGIGERKLRQRRSGVLHNSLGAVSVMNIKVNDGNAAERVAVNASRVSRSKRHVVEKAEAMGSGSGLTGSRDGPVRSRVVTRGPHGAEDPFSASRHDAINRLDDGTRRTQGSLERVLAHLRVAVDGVPRAVRGGVPGGNTFADALDLADVGILVNPEHVGHGRGPHLGHDVDAGELRCAQNASLLVHQRLEAVHVLRGHVVARPRYVSARVVQEALVRGDDDRRRGDGAGVNRARVFASKERRDLRVAPRFRHVQRGPSESAHGADELCVILTAREDRLDRGEVATDHGCVQRGDAPLGGLGDVGTLAHERLGAVRVSRVAGVVQRRPPVFIPGIYRVRHRFAVLPGLAPVRGIELEELSDALREPVPGGEVKR
mmetsp:Transcript_11060/g.51233  ORF Transcript_11060/g.51233 Transcript_11060/m.51233 type:complete len:436 (+) Transcript_11060:1001-2308(+)